MDFSSATLYNLLNAPSNNLKTNIIICSIFSRSWWALLFQHHIIVMVCVCSSVHSHVCAFVLVLSLGLYAYHTRVLPLNCVCCPVLINFLYNFLIASIVVLLSVHTHVPCHQKTKALLVDNRSLYYWGPTVREHNFIGHFLEPGREKWEWYCLNIVYAH